MKHFIAIDTETGGLIPGMHPLLAIAACCSWSDAVFEMYITPESQPDKVLDPIALEANGYTPELWAKKKAVTLRDAMVAFVTWRACRRTEQPEAKLVCHHTAFDRPFIDYALEVTETKASWIRYDWRCSMTLFLELMDKGMIEAGSGGLHRLGALCGFWEKQPEPHSPLTDALACKTGYNWLLDVMEKPDKVLQQLYSNSVRDRRRLEALLLKGLDPLNRGASLIAEERARQIIDEHYSPESDDKYSDGELLRASSCYTWAVWNRHLGKWNDSTLPPSAWPWALEDFKPRNDLRDCIRAGALLAAHIDLLERMEARKTAAKALEPQALTGGAEV